VSVGTDVVQVSRLEGIIERWGEGFLRRAFTELELAYCRAKQWPVVHLAGRLAGKEAVYKALDWQRAGRGSWSRIEVLSGATGKPYVVLPAGTHRGRGYAGSWASEAPALSHVDVSIAHDGDYAVAVAYAVWSEG
jgi:holo-[acyl-carrier protein] synthase